VAEFFAGIGLVRLALEECGFTTVFANDIDPDKFAMYKANFPTAGFHLGDIHRLNANDIPNCDLTTASFPCTDLSIAGACFKVPPKMGAMLPRRCRLRKHVFVVSSRWFCLEPPQVRGIFLSWDPSRHIARPANGGTISGTRTI
jgi:site-specific DNA-cytosine methylase